MLSPWNFTLHRDHSKKLYYEFGGHFILVDNGGPLLLVGERGFWYVPLTLVATWPASCLICYYLISLMVCSGHNKDTLYPFVTICDILLWVKLQTNLPVAAGHGNMSLLSRLLLGKKNSNQIHLSFNSSNRVTKVSSFCCDCIRVIHKVRKTQNQNPEFGHTVHKVRFKKNLQKRTLAIQRGMKLRKPSILVVNWVSSCLSFFLSRLHCCYVYFHCS
jgi:hypothetical protein